MDALAWIDDELAAHEHAGLLRQLRTYEGSTAILIASSGQTVVNFASNDYLNLAGDLRLSTAVREALERQAWGSAASPLITGHTKYHAELEHDLAEFEKTEAALVFSSGYAANVGTITSLVERGDVILSDARNHASIIDGCRLSGARIQVYPHLDMEFLEKMLAQASGFRRRLIVTDSLFSMDGDLAPLDTLVTLAKQFDAMLMIDEAHATGVFGQQGRGVAEWYGPHVTEGVHVKVGTLSKALGCAGGFVAGSTKLIAWLVNRARPYIFSTAQAAPGMAAAQAALQIIRSEPERRHQLLATSRQVCETLQQQGWSVRSNSQIIPIMIGDPSSAVRMSEQLLQQGLMVPAIRPPSVPEGESLLRLSLSCGHTPEMIDQVLNAFAELSSATA